MSLTACQRKEATTVAPDEVKLSVVSPKAGDTFHKGDTVSIQADITYSTELHGYVARIKGDDGTVYFETEMHSHSDHIVVQEEWTDTLSTKCNLTMELVAVIDHDNNTKTTTVAISSQP